MGPRGRYRHAKATDNCLKLAGSVGDTHTASGQDYRAFGGSQVLDDHVNVFDGRDGRGIYRRHEAAQRRCINHGALHVDRDIQPDRTGPAACRQVKRLVEVPSDIFRRFDYGRIFGDAAHHWNDFTLLVAELAQSWHGRGGQAGRALDLSGEDYHGNRVGPCAMDAVQGVDAAGAGGDIQYRGVAGNACIGFGGHRCGLLMMKTAWCQSWMVGECIIEEHRPATGDEKNVAESIVGQPRSDVVGNGCHVLRHSKDGRLAPPAARRATRVSRERALGETASNADSSSRKPKARTGPPV